MTWLLLPICVLPKLRVMLLDAILLQSCRGSVTVRAMYDIFAISSDPHQQVDSEKLSNCKFGSGM